MESSTTIRPLSQQDSISEITALLRRSYKRLAELGLRYTATWQSDEITQERLNKGTTFLALNPEIVGSITLED